MNTGNSERDLCYKDQILYTATKDIHVYDDLNACDASSSGICYDEDQADCDHVIRIRPEPGYYRFIIPKGCRYGFITRDLVFSQYLKLVSINPLTVEECIEIWNFPKTYEEACWRLGIKPLDEDLVIDVGLTEKDIALKKLETVIRCINMDYGIDILEEDNIYTFENGWEGVFGFDDDGTFSFFDTRRNMVLNAGFSIRLCLPNNFAVQYVCSLNKEFFELWKTYML
jgi:hypothetical protein